MRRPQLPHSCCGRQPATPQERLPGPPSVPHMHLGRLTALAHPCDGIGKTLKLGLVAGSWAGHPAACLGRRSDAAAPKPRSEHWNRMHVTLTMSTESPARQSSRRGPGFNEKGRGWPGPSPGGRLILPHREAPAHPPLSQTSP